MESLHALLEGQHYRLAVLENRHARDQLPALLRRRHAGRLEDGGAGGLRRHAPAAGRTGFAQRDLRHPARPHRRPLESGAVSRAAGGTRAAQAQWRWAALHAGGKNPRGGRNASREVGRARHDRLRILREPDRAVPRPRRRARVDAHLRRLHRRARKQPGPHLPGQALRPAGNFSQRDHRPGHGARCAHR